MSEPIPLPQEFEDEHHVMKPSTILITCMIQLHGKAIPQVIV